MGAHAQPAGQSPWWEKPSPLVGGVRHVRAFGVEYARSRDEDGGELFITKYGWPMARYLDPACWYRGGRYLEHGQRLTQGTGTVYLFRASQPGEPRAEFVIKICRFAEYVPLFMPSTLPENLPGYLAEQARFNSPFEEFGLIEDMRRGRFGPPDLHIRTKRPLAIYCTPTRHALWQLGRSEGEFAEYQRDLGRDQRGLQEKDRVLLDIERQYILLFGWVCGENAEALHIEGELSSAQLSELTRRVNSDLALKGFRILDNKPRHFILRRRKNGQLIRRKGELIYVQVDFELLQRTENYLAWLGQDGGKGWR